MASKLNYSQALMQGQLDQITTKAGTSAHLKLYDGTQPAGPDTAVTTQNLLVDFTCSASAFAPAASAAIPSVLSPNLPANVNASASGQPTWWRVTSSGGTAVVDGSAGTSGCDLTIGTVTSGQPASITAWTITSGNSGH